MLDEINEQPEVLIRLTESNRAAMALVASTASSCGHVVIAARGTSDNAARYAQYVWGARNGLTVGLTTPSLFGPLARPPRLDGALVVGISQSGQSPDLVAVLDEAARQGRPTVAITNDPDSPLAAAAEVVIDLCAGPERAVAATKTYTAQLMAVAAISAAMDADPALASVPEAAASVLDMAPQFGTVEPLIEADRCVVVARGFHFASAFEWALKLQELTQLVAQPYSAADFRHGPMAVISEGFPVLAIVTAGPTADEMTELVADLSERGAVVTTLSDLTDVGGIVIPEVAPWLSPIVAAPALQLHAHAVTLARSLDPDSPRGLSKITRTR